MPRVRVDGQYGRRWHNDEDIINSTVTLEVPLFSGITLKPEIERSVRDYAVIRAQLEAEQQRIALEVGGKLSESRGGG